MYDDRPLERTKAPFYNSPSIWSLLGMISLSWVVLYLCYLVI